MGVHKTRANKENIQRNAFNLQLFLIQCPFLFSIDREEANLTFTFY